MSEKCIRLEQQYEKLKKFYPQITYTDALRLRQQLFEDFIDSLETDYYFEICNEDYMKWILSRVDRQDYYLEHPKEDEKKSH